MLANLANLAVWLLVASSIVVFGWEEPIQYHFMSAASVAAEEKALMPPPRQSRRTTGCGRRH